MRTFVWHSTLTLVRKCVYSECFAIWSQKSWNSCRHYFIDYSIQWGNDDNEWVYGTPWVECLSRWMMWVRVWV